MNLFEKLEKIDEHVSLIKKSVDALVDLGSITPAQRNVLYKEVELMTKISKPKGAKLK